jgi:hypothetical protein
VSKTRITTPQTGYTGAGPGGIAFEDGVAYTDDEAVIAYCSGAGYGIGDDQPVGGHPLDDSELAQLRQRFALEAGDDADGASVAELSDEDLRAKLDEAGVDLAAVRASLAEPVDPRNLPNGGVSVVGTPLRDAAVDPQPEDFLPPTNAGQANPHGPDVVAPEIHAVESQIVRPGPVSSDPAEQQAAETEHAHALLVEGKPVTDVVEGDVEDTTDRGPRGLSDPGSAQVGEDQAGEGGAAADASLVEVPAGNASTEAWQAYALTQPGVTEDDVKDLSRNELRDRYSPKGD